MELKLTQRIILKYYRTKLKVLEKVSPDKAVEYALRLFFTPYSNQSKAERPAIFHRAEKLSFDFNGNTIHGFRWNSAGPAGKTVLVCHGMNSCCYRFEKYIQLLSQKNFNVLAFDAQAHGQSDGKILNAVIYSEIILEIEKLYGPVFGIIAHSVAGMATAFAMEQLKAENKKIILIAPATETVTAIENFFSLLHLKKPFRKIFDEAVEKLRGFPPEWYSVTRAVHSFKSDILWIHDRNDTMCPYNDTLTIQKLQLPHIQFMITEGLGHNIIYRNREVQKKVIDFLAA